MRPRVSILMPVRNAEQFLADALKSLGRQTESDWELIAVDDGSTDGSRKILAEAARADRRIRLACIAQPGAGIAAALELGRALARAPLLARMDADDCCHPERLAAQRRRLEQDPQLFAVGCRVEAFSQEPIGMGMRRYLAWQNSLLEPWELARDRFVEATVLHPTLMLRAAMLDRLGGWRATRWPEDFDLLLRSFERGYRVAKLPAVLYRWRLHPEQTSRWSSCYSPEQFRRARAHFLARTLRSSGRPLWILGAGPTGKRLAKALAAEGLEPTAFADVDPRKIGGHVALGARCAPRWPVRSMDDLFAARPRPIAIAAVGQLGARERIRHWLCSRGWSETEDFWVAA